MMIKLYTYLVIYLHGANLDSSVEKMLQNFNLDTCNIIIAEVLGYKFIDPEKTTYFEELFATMKNHIFDKVVIDKVIELRQTTSIKLPNAIITSTALVDNLVLWTHNTVNFKNIPKLQHFDPITS